MSKEEKLIELVFENTSGKALWIWIELMAYGLTIPNNYEYKIVTDDKYLRFQFEEDNLTLWLESRFGCKILKREIGQKDWELDIDMLEVQ